MNFVLSEPEIRVLGSLIEKEITTPEYYPLTLNSLIAACNQKTNRDPVTSYSECTVSQTLDSLREKDLVIVCHGRDSRVPKYDNYFADKIELSVQETAVMCVLMLRGPQTPGEIRTRAERMHAFAELSDVEAVLEGLVSRESGALVAKCPRQPGHKENRYAHLLDGTAPTDLDNPALPEEKTARGTCAEIERIDQLETEVDLLRQEMQDLRQQFVVFKKQFE